MQKKVNLQVTETFIILGINVFTKEGRQELLRKEILYYRNGSSNRYNTTDQDEIKNNQIYTNYYGFGLL